MAIAGTAIFLGIMGALENLSGKPLGTLEWMGVAGAVAINVIPFATYVRQVYHKQNAATFGIRTMRISEIDLKIVMPSGVESTLPWSLVQRAEYGQGMTFLYIAHKQSVPVSDSAFKSEADLQQFRSMVRAKVPKLRGLPRG